MLSKLLTKISGFLVFGIFIFPIHTQTAFAQPLIVQTDAPLGRIAPKNILVEQTHQEYENKDHRYRLTIQGDNLNEETKDIIAVFSWKTNCGRFYEGGEGPSSRYLSHRNKTVVWGYTYPEENCSEAEIQIKVDGYKGSDRQDQVILKQKVFHPELHPYIDYEIYRGITPGNTLSFGQKIQLFFDNLWYKLKLLTGVPADDPTTTEVPDGKSSIRD